MFERYKELLPKQYHYLADRILNLPQVFRKEEYPKALLQTISAILGLVDSSIDFIPYLHHQTKAPVRL